MRKKFISFFLMLVSTGAFAQSMICEDFDVDTTNGPTDIRVALSRTGINSFAAELDLNQNGHNYKSINQESMTLWTTYGAEVFTSEGLFTESTSTGDVTEFSDAKFVISRMMVPEGAGMVSISFKSKNHGSFAYVSRGCRLL